MVRDTFSFLSAWILTEDGVVLRVFFAGVDSEQRPKVVVCDLASFILVDKGTPLLLHLC